MSIYDLTVTDIAGNAVSLEQYRGKVMLIVNTASKCGFTPQFDGLEALYQAHRADGFVVLGFPCDQFAHQDPGEDEEIASFCRLNFGVTFPMMAKIEVNGDKAAPLFVHLKKEQPGLLGGGIKWNFTKFLVDREGHVVDRFAPQTPPAQISKHIARLL